MFSDVWSENGALLERLIQIHSNPPILYHGFNCRHLIVCPAEWHERVRQENWQFVNALLLPSRRTWMIKLPQFRNPVSIVNKIAGYDIWWQNLACFKILTNKTYNDKLPNGWSRCKNLYACAWQNNEFLSKQCVHSRCSARHSTTHQFQEVLSAPYWMFLFLTWPYHRFYPTTDHKIHHAADVSVTILFWTLTTLLWTAGTCHFQEVLPY